MAEDFIRYDVLVQDALRGVVRKVLREVAESGLPANHHFYIAFDTQATGVRISSRLRQQYPEEMTIVLQHQFWDLNVTEHAFEAGLSFGGVPERRIRAGSRTIALTNGAKSPRPNWRKMFCCPSISGAVSTFS
jgi:hypothetical protein